MDDFIKDALMRFLDPLGERDLAHVETAKGWTEASNTVLERSDGTHDMRTVVPQSEISNV